MTKRAGDRRRSSPRRRAGGEVSAAPEIALAISTPGVGHLPVLPGLVAEVLAPAAGETILDCTVGRGGHAAMLASRVGPSGTIVGVDLDVENLRFAEERVNALGQAKFVPLHASFADAPSLLVAAGFAADGVIADLGFASTQITDAQRGLSFGSEGPLDMRYDRSRGRTAAELIAQLGERELAETLRMLGEEPLAQRIAKLIANRRRRGAIATTTALAELVREAYGPRAKQSRLHPATRTFMALRIAVNDELNALARLLAAVEAAAESTVATNLSSGGPSPARATAATRSTRSTPAAWLRPGARIAVISFHSLEDRLVKQAFARLAGRGLAVRLTRSPLIASEAELELNPRARSAKLRAVRLPRLTEQVEVEQDGEADEERTTRRGELPPER